MTLGRSYVTRGGRRYVKKNFFGEKVRKKIVEEKKGFEPLIQFYPYTFLAGRCLQPLGHFSKFW
jgi:hypothetical protein